MLMWLPTASRTKADIAPVVAHARLQQQFLGGSPFFRKSAGRGNGFPAHRDVGRRAVGEVARRQVGVHAAEFHVPEAGAPVAAGAGVGERSDEAIGVAARNGLQKGGMPAILHDHVLVDKGDPFRCRQRQPTIARRPGIKALRRMQYRHALDLGKTARGIAVTAVRDDDRTDTRGLPPQRRDDLL